MISRKRLSRANEVAAKLYYIWHQSSYGSWFPDPHGNQPNFEINKRWFGMYRSTQKFCRRMCCTGYKRKYAGITRKEEESNASFREQIRELNV